MTTTTEKRTVMRPQVVKCCDLRLGDVVSCSNGRALIVREADTFGACTIVEFTDGTATAPLPSLMQVHCQRPEEVTS